MGGVGAAGWSRLAGIQSERIKLHGGRETAFMQMSYQGYSVYYSTICAESPKQLRNRRSTEAKVLFAQGPLGRLSVERMISLDQVLYRKGSR